MVDQHRFDEPVPADVALEYECIDCGAIYDDSWLACPNCGSTDVVEPDGG